MTDQLPPIYFYLPHSDWPEGELPESADTYWQWQCARNSTYNWSLYNWTLQTYLRLRSNGFPCELIGTMPVEGIVLAHRYSLADDLQPGPRLLLVCLQADKGRHTYAQVHVVQNSEDDIFKSSQYLWQAYHIPLWPQPGLIPRDPARGDRFENVVYLGRERELAPELTEPSWQEQMQKLGLAWQVRGKRESWNEYSDVDAIVAVRSFKSQNDYNWKPPSKLLNAWHAGIPAILGCEAAYRVQRRSELDYIEVTSVSEVIAALQLLRDDKGLRQAIIENGRIRAKETQAMELVKRWQNFITEIAVPAYDRWCTRARWQRQAFLQGRYLDVTTRGTRSQIRRWRGYITGPVKSLLRR